MYTDAYSEDDRQSVEEIRAWLGQDGNSQATLVKGTKLKESTLNLIVNGKYPSSPSAQLALMRDFIRAQSERKESVKEVPFLKLTVYKLINAACHRARAYRNFSVVTGAVGVGKTRALEEYAAAIPSAILIEADPDMTSKAVLEDIAYAVGAGKGIKTETEMFRAVVKKLKDSERIILVDEAEKLRGKALETLRRIRDKARVGVVLVGTEALSEVLNKASGQFDQVRSRAGFWPKHVPHVSCDEYRAVLENVFGAEMFQCKVLEKGEEKEVDPIILAFHEYGKGSMRMLVEHLIPSAVDYGMSKGKALSANLVKDVATRIISLG
jgi:DNA transposition AAA+ family ATPase